MSTSRPALIQTPEFSLRPDFRVTEQRRIRFRHLGHLLKFTSRFVVLTGAGQRDAEREMSACVVGRERDGGFSPNNRLRSSGLARHSP